MGEKECTRCKLTKPLDAFSNRARNKSTGKQPQCKACNALYEKGNSERISLRAKLYRERVREQRAESQKIYRDNRRSEMGDAVREYHRKYAVANKVRIKALRSLRKEKEKRSLREYAKKNRAILNASHSKRRAQKRKATPIWADYRLIAAFYQKAKDLTDSTGIEHEVDHIVPIRSKIVCGLHCQANLQILTATQNNSKGNRNWPDMP